MENIYLVSLNICLQQQLTRRLTRNKIQSGFVYTNKKKKEAKITPTFPVNTDIQLFLKVLHENSNFFPHVFPTK